MSFFSLFHRITFLFFSNRFQFYLILLDFSIIFSKNLNFSDRYNCDKSQDDQENSSKIENRKYILVVGIMTNTFFSATLSKSKCKKGEIV
ncbi:hypothetical protein C7B90_20735 [Lysinibacillus fusiformis]|nr:hypothetical protein LSP_05515 [Lysinibacillus sphaericus]RDV26410.1 hypothetical protein C7B90_20735 [Lysinibacillus fusiformis]